MSAPRVFTFAPMADQPRADAADFSMLFHRLNNQLGIILANAELLEARSTDEMSRARAAQVVASAIEAIATTRDLRTRVDAPRPRASS